MIVPMSDLATLVDRARGLVEPRQRRLLGIAGVPGAGKSTLAEAVASALGTVVVAMDGYHLSNAELHRLGRHERKGAPDTFDAAGYIAVLRELRANAGVVRAPMFDRSIEEPVQDAITVPRDASLVITEGNYLLLDVEPWTQIRPLLEEIWFVEVDEAARIERLVARHVRFGRSPAEARERVTTGSDAANARVIAATRDRADLVLRLPSDGTGPQMA